MSSSFPSILQILGIAGLVYITAHYAFHAKKDGRLSQIFRKEVTAIVIFLIIVMALISFFRPTKTEVQCPTGTTSTHSTPTTWKAWGENGPVKVGLPNREPDRIEVRNGQTYGYWEQTNTLPDGSVRGNITYAPPP